MKERILVLGTTGIEKEHVLRQLKIYATSLSQQEDFLSLDFEKEYISKVLKECYRQPQHYFNADDYMIRDFWSMAWDKFMLTLENYEDKHILLCLHGVITRGSIGTRSPINIQSILDWKPTKIITLIDNVYNVWKRTEIRANGIDIIGRPTLEQLLDARRTEIFIGDLIAGQLQDKNHTRSLIPHYVLAIQHPARTLYRLLFKQNVLTVYLSFPISDPRKMLEKKNDSGILQVNSFLQKANEIEKNNTNLVCFCPLTIDEKPLALAFEKLKDQFLGERLPENLEFSLQNIWDVKDFWGGEVLLCGTNDVRSLVSIPTEQVQDAIGLINSDVGLRDYRLVRQASRLCVLNPIFNGKATRGVECEIDMAGDDDKRVHIYQDPKHDPEKKYEVLYGRRKKGGSLGQNPRRLNFYCHKDYEELFAKLLQ